MGFNYSPPDHPQQPGPFPEQHGYADIKFDTHKYNGKPSPLNPTTHHTAGSFEKFSKNENTKKAGNFVLGQLKGFLLRQCTWNLVCLLWLECNMYYDGIRYFVGLSTTLSLEIYVY